MANTNHGGWLSNAAERSTQNAERRIVRRSSKAIALRKGNGQPVDAPRLQWLGSREVLAVARVHAIISSGPITVRHARSNLDYTVHANGSIDA